MNIPATGRPIRKGLLHEYRCHHYGPPRGANGFGYDAMFVAEGESRTFGEMEPDEKHAISHRADAFRKLVAAAFT